MFDQLLILCKGRPAYYGPAATAIDYFNERGLHCDRFTNPADFFLDMVTPGDSTGQTEEDIERLLDSYRAPQRATEPESPHSDLILAAAHFRRVRANWLQQLAALLRRDFMNQLRNPLILRVQLVQCIGQGLLFGLIFFGLAHDQQGLYSRQGSLIFFTVSQIFTTVQSVIYTVPRELPIFFHERDQDLYSIFAYFFSKFLTAVPSIVLFPSLFSSIIYYMIGFNPMPERFFTFLGFMILGSFGGTNLGLMISALAPRAEVAVVLAPFVAIFQVLFGGQFLNLKDIPVWGIWLPPISIPRWTFNALIVNEFQNTTWSCHPNEFPCVRTGNEIIEEYNFPDFPFAAMASFILAIGSGFWFIGYIVLVLKDWWRLRK